MTKVTDSAHYGKAWKCAKAMAEAMTRPPYQAPAKAPVLYIKPPNTWRPHRGVAPVPAEVDELEVNANLAVVMGRSIGRAGEAEAMDAVLGYTIAIDVCIPHASLYRPAIRQRCRDASRASAQSKAMWRSSVVLPLPGYL